MSYILVCSPSGTDIECALHKLAQHLGYGDTKLVDVERVLFNSWQAKEKLGVAGLPSESPSMLDITWHLSRFAIKDLWKVAAKQCISDIASSREGAKIVCCNLVYYGGRRDEFYSVVNPQILCTNGGALRPSHIAVLIDDVYDMYVRLSEGGEIFDLKAWTREYFRRIESEEGVRIRAAGQRRLCTYFLESQLAVMTRLLAWRNLETIVAENLAFQFQAKFMVWGVKQLSEVVASWLKDPGAVSVYLSHPIARPRRKWRAEKTWPDVVAQFNCLQKDLFAEGLICVMPTAINELRIAREGSKRHTLLEERWSLPAEIEDNVLYCKPLGTADMHHAGLIASKVWDFGKQEPVLITDVIKSTQRSTQLDALLGAFEREIQTQTSARDHLLVSHTAGLLVFRPFIWDGEFSGGVEAEIRHWEFLAKADGVKRAVFLHFDEDVKAWLANHKRDVESGTTDWMVRGLRAAYRLSPEKAKHVSDWIRSQRGGVLDSGPLPRREMQRIAEKMPDIKRKAKIGLLRAVLTAETGIGGLHVGLWVLRDAEDLKRNYGEIAQFLKSGKEPSNDWHDRIDSLLPDAADS